MNAAERERLWREAVRFHGHSCPGLAVGVRIALDFMERFAQNRAEDEEIVVVAETDACGVDGMQVILGCTAGKGNLWLRRRGKNAFTIFRRKAGEGLRYHWRGFAREGLERAEKTAWFLNGPAEELYDLGPARLPLPPEAARLASRPCSDCGELTAEPCLRVRGGGLICLDCANLPFDLSRRIEL